MVCVLWVRSLQGVQRLTDCRENNSPTQSRLITHCCSIIVRVYVQHRSDASDFISSNLNVQTAGPETPLDLPVSFFMNPFFLSVS